MSYRFMGDEERLKRVLQRLFRLWLTRNVPLRVMRSRVRLLGRAKELRGYYLYHPEVSSTTLSMFVSTRGTPARSTTIEIAIPENWTGCDEDGGW